MAEPTSQFLREQAGRLTLAVKVQPRASRNEIVAGGGAELRVRVTAPPVDSAANAALIEFLAGVLRCSRGQLSLVRGQTSRHKLIEIRGLTVAEIRERLGR